jgi:hypothetical protein
MLGEGCAVELLDSSQEREVKFHVPPPSGRTRCPPTTAAILAQTRVSFEAVERGNATRQRRRVEVSGTASVGACPRSQPITAGAP